MSDPIFSTSNPRVKELVKLRESARHRKLRGLFVIEGFSDLNSIFEFHKTAEEIYFCSSMVQKAGLSEKFEFLKTLKIPLIELAKDPFLKASYRKNSDGILTVAKQWTISLNQISLKQEKICVVLDEVEKPGNLGAILRTMEALGIKSLLLSDSCVDFFNPNVVRSSRGLLAGIQVGRGTKEEVNLLLTKEKFFLTGTSGSANDSFWEHRFVTKTAIIFGSEKKGLSQFWIERLHSCLKIPMFGKADSLNLNTSVACILAEYNRQVQLLEGTEPG